MTRFARAKGSKASNERLPEHASSWSEMKEELLNKTKELAEEKDREAAIKRRQANYDAFLQEKEEEAYKKIAWADFPDAKHTNNTGKTPKKRQVSLTSEYDNDNGYTRALSRNKRAKTVSMLNLNGHEDSEDSNGEFSALKLQIDQVLLKEEGNVSDSDDAPEEIGIKEKPQEIVVKKAKRNKQKLKIVLAKEEQLSNEPDTSTKTNEVQAKKKNIEKGKIMKKVNEKNLTEKDKRLIEKKLERKKKQNETKKLKKQGQKEKNSLEGPKSDLAEEQQKSDVEKSRTQRKLEKRKRQKEKLRMIRLSNKPVESKKEENLTEADLENIQKKKARRARQAEKRKKFREAKALAAEKGEEGGLEINENECKITTKNESLEDKGNNFKNRVFNQELPIKDTTNAFNKNTKNFEQAPTNNFLEREPLQKRMNKQPSKKAKPRDNKEHSSRKQKPERMFINGITIEVDYVDGFPVKKDDADRLRKLRKEMISRGLPRSEINVSLKLERRRAEKAFAREKKSVCFNCRKSGHNLSECPELEKDQMAQTSGTGICFKCGSTEHTHYECKVVKGLDYKFASCFICKEQGHIARQCPDNQRGLYPKGGSCKVCGDVTHMKKDCPKYHAQQAQLQSSLSIGTLDNGNPDDLSMNRPNSSFSGPGKFINKVVKF